MLAMQVDDLTEKVQQLLGDAALRQKMAEAARKETLQWDWRAATSVLRNLQYAQAEKNFVQRTQPAEGGSWCRNLLRLPASVFSPPPTPIFNMTMP